MINSVQNYAIYSLQTTSHVRAKCRNAKCRLNGCYIVTVTTHQDATYLYTEPETLLGVWIALDDATQENGCLWIAPGSHKSGVHRRFIRNKDPDSNELLIFDKAAPHYSQSCFTPVPVRKGTCILLHGQVLHLSAPNRSNVPRHAYTFHILETKDTIYAKENWLQPPACGFPKLYLN